jgi:hypothetical protein
MCTFIVKKGKAIKWKESAQQLLVTVSALFILCLKANSFAHYLLGLQSIKIANVSASSGEIQIVHYHGCCYVKKNTVQVSGHICF